MPDREAMRRDDEDRHPGAGGEAHRFAPLDWGAPARFVAGAPPFGSGTAVWPAPEAGRATD